MKTYFYTFILVSSLLYSSTLLAQNYGFTAVKVGYYDPRDAKGGLIIGGVIGTAVDEAVDVGVGLDFFRGSNKKETKTGETSTVGGTTETAWRLDAESSSTIIPILAQASIRISASSQLSYAFGGGIGYELFWAKEKEYNESGEAINSKSRFYHGFDWMLTGGILYKLGTRSALIIEALYNGSELSRTEDNITFRVNPSGFGIRAGIRFGVIPAQRRWF